MNCRGFLPFMCAKGGFSHISSHPRVRPERERCILSVTEKYFSLEACDQVCFKRHCRMLRTGRLPRPLYRSSSLALSIEEWQRRKK